VAELCFPCAQLKNIKVVQVIFEQNYLSQDGSLDIWGASHCCTEICYPA